MLPIVLVEGVGARALAVPPVALVPYQFKFVPPFKVAVNAEGVAF